MPLINYEKVFDDLADEIAEIAESKGFWDYEDVGENGLIPLKLALVHTEVSEALEAYRKSYDDEYPDLRSGMTPMQEEDFTEELADTVIRILDIIGFYNLDDFGRILMSKIETNRERPYRHGKRYG